VLSATLIACGLLVPAGVSADADGSVPAPTLSIMETVLGQPPPVVSSTGRSDVTDPGRAASLQVSGVNRLLGKPPCPPCGLHMRGGPKRALRSARLGALLRTA
jgi:hypothetical protein